MSTRTPKSAKGLAQLAVDLARQCRRLADEEHRIVTRVNDLTRKIEARYAKAACPVKAGDVVQIDEPGRERRWGIVSRVSSSRRHIGRSRWAMRWNIMCWRSRRNGSLVGGYIYVSEGGAKVTKVEQAEEE